MVKAASRPRKETAQRRGAIALIGRAIGLEIVDPDFRRSVLVPTGLGEKRRHMTTGAIGFPFEERLASLGGGSVEAAPRRLGNQQRQLVKLQSCQLGGDQVLLGPDIRKTEAGSNWKRVGVVETRVVKSS